MKPPTEAEVDALLRDVHSRPLVQLGEQCPERLRRCYELGVAYQTGHGPDGGAVAKDYKKAQTLFRYACSLNDSYACHGLGRMHEFGQGFEQDLGRALALYEHACALGDTEVCYYAGYIHSQGKGMAEGLSTAVDQKQAAEYYRRACLGGHSDSCLARIRPPVVSEAVLKQDLRSEIKGLGARVLELATDQGELPKGNVTLRATLLSMQWHQVISAAEYTRVTLGLTLGEQSELGDILLAEEMPGRPSRAMVEAEVMIDRGPAALVWGLRRGLHAPIAGECDAFTWTEVHKLDGCFGDVAQLIANAKQQKSSSCQRLASPSSELTWIPTAGPIAVCASAGSKTYNLRGNYSLTEEGTVEIDLVR